ncbi:MAG: hypothetical protein WCK27_28160 [Verrucomicrobiota bacterium]
MDTDLQPNAEQSHLTHRVNAFAGVFISVYLWFHRFNCRFWVHRTNIFSTWRRLWQSGLLINTPAWLAIHY